MYTRFPRRIFRAMLLVVVTACASFATASAGAPGAPVGVRGQVALGPSTGTAFLTWLVNTAAFIPESFRVYMADGETHDPSRFRVLLDASVFSRANGYDGCGGFSLIPLPPGTYSFYVTCSWRGQESDPSSIVTLTVAPYATGGSTTVSPADSIGITNDGGITFETVAAGKEMAVDYGAVNNSDDPVAFELLAAPAGMTIDPTRGRVHWLTSGEGSFRYVLHAYNVNKPERGALLEQQVVVAGTAGVSDRADAAVAAVAAPNPAGSTLRVTLPAAARHVALLDARGVTVLRADAAGASVVTLDVSSLPCGAYFLTIDGRAGAVIPVSIAR